MILREHFLLNALKKAVVREKAFVATDYQPLIDDLTNNQEYLQGLVGGALLPAIAALSSRSSREWERRLVQEISRRTDQWESVLRLSQELTEITRLHDRMIGDAKPDADHALVHHRARIAAHLVFLQKVVEQWVCGKQARTHRIHRRVESSRGKIQALWEPVLEETVHVSKREFAPLPPMRSWRSLHRVLPLLVQSLMHYTREAPASDRTAGVPIREEENPR